MPEPEWDILEFPVGLKEVSATVGEENDELLQIPNTRAIFREDTRQILDLVSNRYRLIPHGEIFRPLDRIVRKLPFAVTECSTRLGKGGGYASVEWEFDREVEVVPGDIVSLSLFAKNSLDRSAKLQFELAARRLICSNGMRGPGPAFKRSWRHRRSLDEEKALAWVSQLFERVPKALEHWQAWTTKRIYPSRLGEFLEKDPVAISVVGKKARERIIERATQLRIPRTAHVTLWNAYNCLTEHATHHVQTRKKGLHALRVEEVHGIALRFVQSVSKN